MAFQGDAGRFFALQNWCFLYLSFRCGCYCHPQKHYIHKSEIPPVLLGIPWPALGGPLRNHFWKKKRPQPYWGGDNSGNALEASNALNYRVWGIPAVLSTGIPGNALRAFPGSFRNSSGISSGKSQPYWGYGSIKLVVKWWKLFLSPTLWRAPPLISANLR